MDQCLESDPAFGNNSNSQKTETEIVNTKLTTFGGSSKFTPVPMDKFPINSQQPPPPPPLVQFQGNAQLYRNVSGGGGGPNELNRIDSIHSYPGTTTTPLPSSFGSNICNWFQRQFPPLPLSLSSSAANLPQQHQSFFLNRFYAISTLVGTLLFLVLLNIVLTIWIVTSLNLHKEGYGLKYFENRPHHHQNFRRPLFGDENEIKFQIDGNLAIESSLLVESIKGGHHHRHRSSTAAIRAKSKDINRQTVFDQLENSSGKFNQNLSPKFRIESSPSSNSITLRHINPIDNAENSVTLSDNGIELKTTNLVIKRDKHHHHSHHRVSLFSIPRHPDRMKNSRTFKSEQSPSTIVQITPKQLIIDADQFASSVKQQQQQLKPSTAGIRIEQQLSTGKIGANIGHDLRLESRTESVSLSASNQIELESVSGNIELTAYEDIVLNSHHISQAALTNNDSDLILENHRSENSQTIQFDSRSVILSHIIDQHNKDYRHSHHHRHRTPLDNNLDADSSKVDPIAYQLCLCSNGNLFAADVGAICQSDTIVCASR